MENGRLFFEVYVKKLGPVTVIDVGSLDVNGSLRSVCPPQARYVGLDLAPGKGVDVVLEDQYALPFPDGSQDVVVSSSCFEHSEMFWLVFVEALRILKPSGLFYLNAPSNGAFHRYPVDCWRFYPEAGKALVAWARRCGLNAALLESYTFRRRNGTFNDYVAVFVKDERHADDHPARITDKMTGFTNGVVRGRAGILRFCEYPGDLVPRCRSAVQSLPWRCAAVLRRLLGIRRA